VRALKLANVGRIHNVRAAFETKIAEQIGKVLSGEVSALFNLSKAREIASAASEPVARVGGA
jgi:hypothetical protein